MSCPFPPSQVSVWADSQGLKSPECNGMCECPVHWPVCWPPARSRFALTYWEQTSPRLWKAVTCLQEAGSPRRWGSFSLRVSREEEFHSKTQIEYPLMDSGFTGAEAACGSHEDSDTEPAGDGRCLHVCSEEQGSHSEPEGTHSLQMLSDYNAKPRAD